MPIAKTEKARAALASRDPALGPRERQLLVMCDGAREASDLLNMLGPQVQTMLLGLIAGGYLVDLRHVPKGDLSQTGTFYPDQLEVSLPRSGNTRPAALPRSSQFAELSEPTTSSAPLVAQPAPVAKPAAAPAAPGAMGGAPRVKRSLAGSKMYMMDRLQLIRDPNASSHAVAIHTSDDSIELVDNLMGALMFIAAKSGVDYAKGISERLRMMLPEEHLVSLDHTEYQLFPQPLAA
jgi:hypothetical protein